MKPPSDQEILHIQNILKKKNKSRKEESDIELFFKELYDTYSEGMVRLISPILFFRHEIISDVLQEAWIDIFQSFHRYDANRNLKNWIAVIFYRKAKKQIIQLAKEKTDTIHDKPVESGIDTEVEYEKNNDLDKLQKALKKLSQDDYLLVDLFFFQNKKVSQICKELDISRGTFYYRYNRIRKKIIEFINKENI